MKKRKEVLVQGREFLWDWEAGVDVIRYAITQVPFTPFCLG